MKNSIRLSIPNPCAEKWENFTPTSTGGFCSSCYKTVVDFTKMSDAEIIKFMKDKPAHTCGRFRNDQLKEYTELPVYNIRPSRMLLRAGVISLFLALVGRPSFAHTPVEPVKKEVTVVAPSRSGELTSPATPLVYGIVKDEYGDPIPGVNILLVGTSFGTISDADGKFEFATPLKEGDILQFSFIGYQTEKYRVGAVKEAWLTITMQMDIQLMGEVIVVAGNVDVTEAYTPKKKSRSVLSVFKRWF